MTDREVMKMALHGLLDAREVMILENNDKNAYQDEIEALRQALAQPEQEPVAYLYHDTACAELANPLADSTLLVLACDRKPNGRNETPLYAAPPSKPDVNQELVEPQLHPKDVIKLALKAGFTKDAINVWLVSMEKLIAFAAPPSKEK